MVNELCTVSHRLSWYEKENIADLYDCIKYMLQRQMGDYIVKETADLIEETKNPPVFKLTLAILTPQRYEELLEAEHRLKDLEW